MQEEKNTNDWMNWISNTVINPSFYVTYASDVGPLFHYDYTSILLEVIIQSMTVKKIVVGMNGTFLLISDGKTSACKVMLEDHSQKCVYRECSRTTYVQLKVDYIWMV